MTVQELMDTLRGQSQDAEVYLEAADCAVVPACGVTADVLVIPGESRVVVVIGRAACGVEE